MQEALLAATGDWHVTLAAQGSVGCVFFDLSKSLPHSLILESLSRVGVTRTLLSWFRDYFSGRHQHVCA